MGLGSKMPNSTIISKKKQYTRYSIFKRNFLNFAKKNIPECVETDILFAVDDNKQPYAYIHVKDYSDNTDFRKVLGLVYSFLNKYKYIEINYTKREAYFWIPKFKDVKSLCENGETYWINRFINENVNK